MGSFSEIVSGACPYCEASSNFQKISETHNGHKTLYGFFQCPQCQNAILVQRHAAGGNSTVWPEPQTPEVPEHLPENIHNAFLDAERCLINKIFHAAATEARRTLELAVVDLLDRSANNLYNDIEQLRDEENLKKDKKDRVLPKAMTDWAHNIRIVGKNLTHNNTHPQYSEKDSREALEFTRMFLTYAFTLPERIEKTRGERENRNSVVE